MSTRPAQAASLPPGPRLRPSRRWVLPALLAGLVAARLAIVLSLGDVFFYGEELAKGTAAKAMLEGVIPPHFQRAYHYYEGGGFLFSHLDAAAFAVLGQNLLALKLVAIAWSAIMLAAGWWSVKGSFGRPAAVAFGLFFILAPKSFLRLGLLALGIHFEACLFLLLALGALARVAIDDDDRPTTWATLGFALGFGLTFSLQTVPLLGFCLLVLAWRRPRALRSSGAVAAAALFVVGLLPMAWMASHVGERVLDVHGMRLEGPRFSTWQAWGKLLRSLFVERRPFEALATVLWWTVPAALAVHAWSRAASTRTRAALGLWVAYGAVFWLAYSASPFAVGTVYHGFKLARLSPFWMIGSVLAAAGAGLAWEQRRRRDARLALAAAAVLLALGARDAWRGVREGTGTAWASNARVLLHRPGYAYRTYAGIVSSHLSGSLRDKLVALSAFSEPHPARLRRELARALMIDPALDLEAACALARDVDPDHWLDFAEGFGPLWVHQHGVDARARLQALQQVPEPLRSALAFAQGNLGGSFRVDRASLQSEIDLARSIGAPPAWLRGIGYRAWSAIHDRSSMEERLDDEHAPPFQLQPDRGREFLAAQAEDARADLLAGFERASVECTLP